MVRSVGRSGVEQVKDDPSREGTAVPRLEAVRKLASVGREAVEKGSISVTAS